MTPSEAASLLGVSADASISEVQHAFVREARRSHPDLLDGASAHESHAAGLRFAQLSVARDVLMALHPIIPVRFIPPPSRTRPKGIGGSVVILLLLASVLVVGVTMADAYRSETVQNLRGGVTQTP